ncbi:MAG: efflux RND transporter permease subunit [Desulfobacteraceae bacterium]|nr:efflux RND transporter permease subunit [Desulfobacteraceae bacterium]
MGISFVIIVAFPGAGPEKIDELVARPVSSWAMQLERVEEVTSVASNDAALMTVEFEPGVSDAEAYSELADVLAANTDRLPAGAQSPAVRTVGDEQLSTLMVTLSAPDLSGFDLRRIAEETAVRLEEVPGVRTIDCYGSQSRRIEVRPDPRALAAYGIPLTKVVEAIKASNLRLPSDQLRGRKTMDVEAGALLRSVDDIAGIPVGSGPAGIVYLDEVAAISDGPGSAESHVIFRKSRSPFESPAVSLSVTSVPEKNISDINKVIIDRIEQLRGVVIPSEVNVHIGYDAGRMATEQVRSVLQNLLTGTVIVISIILIGLGLRSAITISLVIPATLSFVPFAYYFMGFTLNPVSLAAMIMAIGIISDDSVIMLENTARHFRQAGDRSKKLTIQAIDEVGNPTILAVVLIIATILPTAFLSGEMGQFVRAIPIGTAIAIFASLILALTVIPFLAFRLLPAGNTEKNCAKKPNPSADEFSDGKADDKSTEPPSGSLAEMYRAILWPFMKHPILRWALYALMVLLFVGQLSLVYFRAVQIGFTPLLDREVFVVDLRLPAGTPLEKTLTATSDIGRRLYKKTEVEAYTVFAGIQGPQLYPWPEPMEVTPVSTHQAYIYVHLCHEDKRKRDSHEIGKNLYNELKPVIDRHDARMVVRHLPSGPANKEDMHAEIYAPSDQGRFELAGRVWDLMAQHPATTSVRRSPEEPCPRLSLTVDRTSASARGIFPAEVAQAVHVALTGTVAADMHIPDQRHPVPVIVRLPPEKRELIYHLDGLYLKSRANENMVSMADLVEIEETGRTPDRYRKNGLPVVYVGAKLDRNVNEPYAAQRDISRRLAETGPAPAVNWFSQPENSEHETLHWAGEWELTRQTYGDLGAAGIVAIALIYCILAAWFGSYGVPLLIMMPIPLVLIGVIPAHWLWGQNLTGIGIMGVITLAGIVTRNSVLLVDFIRQNRKSGVSLENAVINAGALRTRPIVLTASTVMLGSGVLIFEPALAPLGLTLASGVLVATLLTLLLIPVLYYHCYSNKSSRNP